MATSDRLSAALSERYRIERELGAGGMATVYLAEDLKHDRKVTIKVLKPELAAVLGADGLWWRSRLRHDRANEHRDALDEHDGGCALDCAYGLRAAGSRATARIESSTTSGERARAPQPSHPTHAEQP